MFPNDSDDGDDNPLLGQFNMEDDIQERVIGHDVLPAFSRDHYPDFKTLQGFVETETERIDERASSTSSPSSCLRQSSIKLKKDLDGLNVGRFPDPFHVPCHAEPFKLFHNVRQRAILIAVVRFLKTLMEWEATDQSTEQPVFRALCCGVVGTGKRSSCSLLGYSRTLCLIIMTQLRFWVQPECRVVTATAQLLIVL